MNKKLYEALEECINALETGADLRSVLKRYPDLEGELAPILEASQQARLLAIAEVPEKALRTGKLRVLQHAAEMRKAAVKPRRRWSMFAFPRLATSLAIALIFLLSGTGLVRASTTALPGDNLYPVKRTWEDVRLMLSFNPKIREELESKFEDERLHEVDELLSEGRHETITFAGLVMEQNGDQWLVSGVPVQITAESILPVENVTVGVSIIVEGNTNSQGFVEASRVEILGSGISLPPFVPAEIDGTEGSNQNENSGIEVDDNSNQDELRRGTSSDDNESGTEDDESNSGKNSSGEDDGDDNSNSGSDDESDDNDSHSDNSGPGGGAENDTGDDD